MIRFLPNHLRLSVPEGLLAITLLVTLLASWTFSGSARAAEAEQSASSAESKSETSSKPEPTDTDKAASTSEVFIPTEDISEDFAVSFPVDI